jgi:DTW domain-containing protein YfiP
VTHRRSKRKPRCPGCGLTPKTCVCDLLPRLRFATPITIVQHVREKYKPTNTGRLLARMVEGTLVLPCGMREPDFDPKPLEDPAIDWRLLYPREGAPVLDLEQPRTDGRRLGFVLLDGSWSQCAHMSRRLPVVAQLPCVALPPGPPSFWTVRAQHNEQGKSTFEAAIHALQLVEGSSAVAPLRRGFAEITARLLYLKGRLRTPEIPTTWGV